LVNADHPQVIEIWNNVFIQFNRLKDGSLEQLPAKHVDTGMGLERLVRVIQGKTSNYDTDLFTGTIAETGKLTGKKYENTDDKRDIAFRVIADHIRAIAFTIADGQLPSNTGAGYVIRRILRRAVRYYYSYLDYKHPLLYQLLPVIGQQFQFVFPELYSQLDFVQKVIKEEEDAFLRTLGKGIEEFEDITSLLAAVGEGGEFKSEKYNSFTTVQRNVLPGEVAFKLYDTFGFPIDLTLLLAREKGWSVEENRFELLMQQQKNRSRAATAMDAEDWIVLDENGFSEFVGYDSLETKSKVLKYRKVTSKGKEAYQLVLNVTPFYAESGGQVGDKGELIFGEYFINVVDTKKENNLIIHFVDKLPNKIEEEVIARVNRSLRQNTEVHHSATHLLHAALRSVLGAHVAQKGSLVNNEHLRFDFSHFAKVTNEEIAKIEALVNQKIRENVPVVVKQMSKDEAVAMGAMALFGEKYGDVVRVVIMDREYSVELCGGTHVGNTGELGFFKIKHESAVAAGVRRIEAVSGNAAEDWINEHLQALNDIKETLKNPKDVKKALEGLQTENAELKKKLESLEAKQLASVKAELLNKVQDVNGVSFIGEIVEASSADNLKKLAFDLKQSLKNYVVALAANVEGKAHVAIMLDEKVSADKNLEAPKIIKEQVAPLIKGGGGGQRTLATAGGQDASNLKQVIEKVKSLL
jgi:alanyl-tRNA synthetase